MSQTPPPPPPPPPPSGEPYGTGAAPAPFSIGDAVGFGWNAFWKNAGPMIVLTLVIVGANLVFAIAGAAADNVGVQAVIRVIGWLVGLLLALGLIRASLAVTRGEQPDVGMLFQSEGFGPYILASILFGLGLLVGLVLFIVPGIIFAIVYHFYGYVIAEQGEAVRPGEALSRSAQITRGHRFELFGLGIVLLLINVVGALLCGIGLLFTYGITALAVAYAYRSLSGQAVVQPR